MCNTSIGKGDRGQTIVVFALVLPILILFAGLALDVGRLYVTKAQLSTSVDAACLTGMKNLTSGQTVAGQLAVDMFQANFGPGAPVPTITFPSDAYGDQQVKVTATANVNTLFMRYLAQWATVPVSDTAVATRGKLVMSIVLDRSGSMSSTNDNGEAALKAAVPLFVDHFDNTTGGDQIAMITFSSNATVDAAMANPFNPAIDNAVAAMNPVGGTFGTGAGTHPILSTTVGAPLSLAQLQNDSFTINPGQNVIKVVVYFTDGLMNAVQDNFYCGPSAPSVLVNYGGCDATGSCAPAVHFLDPNSATADWGNCNSGGDNCASGLVYNSSGAICKDISGNTVRKFVSQQDGSSQYLTMANVTAEAQYRAIQTASAMRTESPVPTYIFTIGLGTNTTADDLLKRLANDPTSPNYIKTQPAGQFFYISTCTGSVNLANCKTELNTAFQTIAAKVLLRLTQ
jgi:Flp pilus assembly protein TadG